MHTMKYDRGFTLIELLVVIAIIGLLASIILASLRSAINSSRVARAKTELQELATAFSYAKSSSGLNLSQMEPLVGGYLQTWSAGGCTNPPNSFNLPTGNLEGDVRSTCYGQWVSDLAAVQTYTGGLYSNLSQFVRDPWGSPYILDEQEGSYGTNNCANDTITSAGPNGTWDVWQGTPGSDDITIYVPNGTSACDNQDQNSGFAPQ